MFHAVKFSIRDLLLLTVIVAMAVGWWVDHRRQASEIKRLYYEQEYKRVMHVPQPLLQLAAPKPPKKKRD